MAANGIDKHFTMEMNDGKTKIGNHGLVSHSKSPLDKNIKEFTAGRKRKYKYILSALVELNKLNPKMFFPSMTIAEKATGLGRKKSEITSRQVGAILKEAYHKGLVESNIVRENNCKHRVWRMARQS